MCNLDLLVVISEIQMIMWTINNFIDKYTVQLQATTFSQQWIGQS